MNYNDFLSAMMDSWFLDQELIKSEIFEDAKSLLEDIIVKPNGVVIKFKDGAVYHAEAHNGDTFSLETGLLWCWFKYVIGDSGISNKIIKASETFIKEKERKKEKEKQFIRDQKKMSKETAKYLKSISSVASDLESAFKEDQIELHKEAYLRAMREWLAECGTGDSEKINCVEAGHN